MILPMDPFASSHLIVSSVRYNLVFQHYFISPAARTVLTIFHINLTDELYANLEVWGNQAGASGILPVGVAECMLRFRHFPKRV
jgi:hypothetical protein